MTIDERLELMAQRLDMAVQIHLDWQREYHERLTRNEEDYRRDREQYKREQEQYKREQEQYKREQDREQEQYKLRQEFLEQKMIQMMDAVNRLARIAGFHEDRLDDHDRRLDNLEGQ